MKLEVFLYFHVIIYSIFMCLMPCYLWKLPPRGGSTGKSSSLPCELPAILSFLPHIFAAHILQLCFICILKTALYMVKIFIESRIQFLNNKILIESNINKVLVGVKDQLLHPPT